NLEGDAKSINYAGSERMRSYKLLFLVNEWLQADEKSRHKVKALIQAEVTRFDDVLAYLREGDEVGGRNKYEEPVIIVFLIELHPSFKYLLSWPGVYEPELKKQIEKVSADWIGEIRPRIMNILVEEGRYRNNTRALILKEKIPVFVNEVDNFVTLLEGSFDRKVSLFTALQYLFLLVTIGVSLIAIDNIFLHLMRSVNALMGGIKAMTAGDFSKRVTVLANDEMRDVAEGFNFMADKLEEFYLGLEGKVEEKTYALEKRNSELSILYDMVASLRKSLPLEEILQIYLEKLLGHLNISAGTIRLFEEDGFLRLAASAGLQANFKKNALSGEYLCRTLSKEYEADAWNVTLRGEVMALEGCSECRFKSVTEIPINFKIKDLGVLNLFHTEVRKYTASEKRLIESLNNHLAAAIEYFNLNAKTKRLAIIEERNMLASELHDSIAQSLAYLKIQGKLLDESLKAKNIDQSLEDLAQIRKGIEECNQDVRELLVHFRTKIESEGLEATLKKFLEKFRNETGINTEFDVEENLPALSPGEEVHIFHIVQEALANARKYADATRVRVSVKCNGTFDVTIEDNGQGFDIEEVKGKGSSHVGIDIMQERAIRLGGVLAIESNSGLGTRVRLTMA
ncbi:MAG: type IV pili methyl-accepting chemotaxis transducer N-terminal domain-containing protein, partial [Proteobacteria bacterium]|nr:type IV pili methyl-accepting chemotaxis transducer N-terminal domain-containing protein [Pseudomonadota bacterium]